MNASVAWDNCDLLGWVETCLQESGYQKFVVACSGGQDSQALLHMLLTLAPKHAWHVQAVYVNHHLHDQAEAMAEAVYALAQTYKASFQAVDVFLEPGGNVEHRARQHRYQALTSFLCARTALLCAHHQDDQFETMLLQACRGGRPEALAGMLSMRALGPSHMIRPLLPFPKKILAAYAEKHALPIVPDPSNQQMFYQRNQVRAALGQLALSPEQRQGWMHSQMLLRECAQAHWHGLQKDLRRHLCAQHQRIPLQALLEWDHYSQQSLLYRIAQAMALTVTAQHLTHLLARLQRAQAGILLQSKEQCLYIDRAWLYWDGSCALSYPAVPFAGYAWCPVTELLPRWQRPFGRQAIRKYLQAKHISAYRKAFLCGLVDCKSRETLALLEETSTDCPEELRLYFHASAMHICGQSLALWHTLV